MSRKLDSSLCWNCKRVYGECAECSWVRNFTPVEGWNAKQDKDGYTVRSCPQFIVNDRIEISIQDVIKIVGISRSKLFRILEKKKSPMSYINRRYLKGRIFMLQRYRDDEEYTYCLKFIGSNPQMKEAHENV